MERNVMSQRLFLSPPVILGGSFLKHLSFLSFFSRPFPLSFQIGKEDGLAISRSSRGVERQIRVGFPSGKIDRERGFFVPVVPPCSMFHMSVIQKA